MRLRYVMQRRWQRPASCEVFRELYTTTDPAEVERALCSGGYGDGFDRTECLGVEVVPTAPVAPGSGGEK